MKNFYSQINDALIPYENYHPHKPYSIDWICNRIDWCWKWKKITAQQKDELCDRIIKVMEGEV